MNSEQKSLTVNKTASFWCRQYSIWYIVRMDYKWFQTKSDSWCPRLFQKKLRWRHRNELFQTISILTSWHMPMELLIDQNDKTKKKSRSHIRDGLPCISIELRCTRTWLTITVEVEVEVYAIGGPSGDDRLYTSSADEWEREGAIRFGEETCKLIAITHR